MFTEALIGETTYFLAWLFIGMGAFATILFMILDAISAPLKNL